MIVRNTFIQGVVLFLWISLLANPAFSIKLTAVKHLFDIRNNFSQPSDISVSKDGLIYIVDGVNNKIHVFDKRGKFILAFGSKGTAKGQFSFPMGIDVDNNGKVYVADSGNHRVQIFNPYGEFYSQIKMPSKDGNLSDPTDIAVNESGNQMYVVDNDNHYILAYDLASHQLLKTFGSPGEGKLQFRYPFLMTLDRDNYLYIVDVINTRVQVLNPSGKFVTFIGGWGVENGEFFRPKGVAIDQDNRVFISDSYMGVIQIFKVNGDFYSAIGNSSGGEVRKFRTPTGLFIDGSNRLYVVEMFAERVRVYEIEEEME